MMSSEKIVLYGYFRSSATWRVRIALAWKGLDYEYRPVNLVKGEQKTEAHTALNSFKQVPVMVLTDGTVLVQSTAILEYLEEAYPENPLLPKDIVQRAVTRSIVSEIACDMQPIQNTKVIAYVSSDQQKRVEWANYWLTIGFEALEKHLAKTAGTYCVGDQVTFADCNLVPMSYNGFRYKVNMSAYPSVLRVLDNLEKLDAFKAAHAHNQSDCLPELLGKSMRDL
ncbi:Maleylacetoacetate isomerase [Umbelopsis sp. PMI_123]|nr:Maleylacetoacetate isomerase [Umbelopsis sp. PMI_123]